jgi:hypothetical protein
MQRLESEEGRATALREVLLQVAAPERSRQGLQYSLVGMDLHPLKNAHQGLACLGSRKDPALPRGNRVLGMMEVSLSADVSARWVEGYAAEAHPLLVAAEASVLVPCPLCIGLASMDAWKPAVHERMMSVYMANKGVLSGRRSCPADTKPAGIALRDELARVNEMERLALQQNNLVAALMSTQYINGGWRLKRKRLLPLKAFCAGNRLEKRHKSPGALAQHGRSTAGASPSSPVPSSFASTQSHNPSSPRYQQQHMASPSMLSSFLFFCAGRKREFVASCMPAWFKFQVASMYDPSVQRHDSDAILSLCEAAFGQCNTEMPSVRSIRPPPAMQDAEISMCRKIHVSGAKICLCTLSMMEVPFKVVPVTPTIFSCT